MRSVCLAVSSPFARAVGILFSYLCLAIIFSRFEANLVQGQASLPEACPVCAHEPVKAELCKANKALRTTIKVFLRTEEKKRETQKGKTFTQGPPPTSATPAVAVETLGGDVASVTEKETVGYIEDVSHDNPTDPNPAESDPKDLGGSASIESQMDIPRPSVEVRPILAILHRRDSTHVLNIS